MEAALRLLLAGCLLHGSSGTDPGLKRGFFGAPLAWLAAGALFPCYLSPLLFRFHFDCLCRLEPLAAAARTLLPVLLSTLHSRNPQVISKPVLFPVNSKSRRERGWSQKLELQDSGPFILLGPCGILLVCPGGNSLFRSLTSRVRWGVAWLWDCSLRKLESYGVEFHFQLY